MRVREGESEIIGSRERERERNARGIPVRPKQNTTTVLLPIAKKGEQRNQTIKNVLYQP